MWFPLANRWSLPRRPKVLSARLGVETLEDRAVPSVYSNLIVFGDSISDTGNGFLFTGGVATAPPYFDGHFSNGPMWVEVLADRLGLPAPAPSLGGGTNYAFGGAETGGGLSFFGTPNVGMQIQMALSDRGGFAADELVVVAAGSNDLAWQPPYSPSLVVRNLSADISELAAAGARTFLVPNLPSPGQNPANRGTSNEVYFDTLTAVVNGLLDRRLAKLEEDLGIAIVRFDMDGVVDGMLHYPGQFGLTNVTDPACPGCGIGIPAPGAAETVVPNPDEYLWWDFIHMSRASHTVIGDAAAEVLQQHGNIFTVVSTSRDARAHPSLGRKDLFTAEWIKPEKQPPSFENKREEIRVTAPSLRTPFRQVPPATALEQAFVVESSLIDRVWTDSCLDCSPGW